jgi:murein L,D-transpeptidase YafK
LSRVPRIALLLALAAAVAWIGMQGGRPVFSLYEDARLFIRDQHRAVNAWLGLPLPGTPDLAALDERLKAEGLSRGDPVFMRIFKRDSELELWMLKDGRFTLFETYPICYWSGRLGPKLAQGDAQSPEGFYTVSKGQLNPNSQYYRSFDLGFPNAFDRSHGRTGAHLMVHGDCVSRGCYAMTDAVMGEIWSLVTAALDGPQSSFGVHVFPFRPTDWRLSLYESHASAQFWTDLKPAFDTFEATRIPPQVFACRGRYVIREAEGATPTHPPVRASCPDALAAL